MKEKTEKEKDETRRFADLHLQAQIPVLSHRIGELERLFRDKFNGYLDRQFKGIYDKLNELNCGVHLEKIKHMEERNTFLDRKINALFGAFVLVVICGIVLGIWMKY